MKTTTLMLVLKNEAKAIVDIIQRRILLDITASALFNNRQNREWVTTALGNISCEILNEKYAGINILSDDELPIQSMFASENLFRNMLCVVIREGGRMGFITKGVGRWENEEVLYDANKGGFDYFNLTYPLLYTYWEDFATFGSVSSYVRPEKLLFLVEDNKEAHFIEQHFTSHMDNKVQKSHTSNGEVLMRIEVQNNTSLDLDCQPIFCLRRDLLAKRVYLSNINMIIPTFMYEETPKYFMSQLDAIYNAQGDSAIHTHIRFLMED